MLQAHIDDSGKGDKHTFVLAGYIATADAWSKFSGKWQRLLDMRSPHYRALTRFKMSEMSSAADRERCGWFYRVIEQHVLAAVSCVIDVQALARVIDTADWSGHVIGVERLKNPYYFAFKAITDLIRQHQKKFGFNEPIDFIFDEDSEQDKCLEGWEVLKKNAPPEYLEMLGRQPAFKDDLTTLPLQAADMYAWWVREWESAGITDWTVGSPRFPWATQREMPLFHAVFDENELRENLDRIFREAMARSYGVRYRVTWDS